MVFVSVMGRLSRRIIVLSWWPERSITSCQSSGWVVTLFPSLGRLISWMLFETEVPLQWPIEKVLVSDLIYYFQMGRFLMDISVLLSRQKSLRVRFDIIVFLTIIGSLLLWRFSVITSRSLFGIFSSKYFTDCFLNLMKRISSSHLMIWYIYLLVYFKPLIMYLFHSLDCYYYTSSCFIYGIPTFYITDSNFYTIFRSYRLS